MSPSTARALKIVEQGNESIVSTGPGVGWESAGLGDARLSVQWIDVLDKAVRNLPGVAEVLVIPREKRGKHPRSKVFVVTATHDLARDRKVIDLLAQLDCDFDLVPEAAGGMIPETARPIR
jgi:hypothetical protein